MKIGYPCINLGLDCRSSRTFRLASYSDKRMRETVASNLSCLQRILEYNLRNSMMFFRITSDLIPFASHDVCTLNWQKVFKKTFHQTGEFIRNHEFRISMHPDQFVLLNSLEERIFQNSVRELSYHAGVLDLLGLDQSAKIQIHIGGVYGDKGKSIERFIRRYGTLPAKIRDRLVIENDERLYSVSDCMDIHRQTGIPVLFDAFHYSCNNTGEVLRDAVHDAALTWSERDGIPMVDYSSQQKGKRPGTHAQSIDIRNFRRFLKETAGLDFDIMLEIKDKERSVLKALKAISERK
ncbi:MAG: UV DNA damage repair endonuclease UvsE [Nitrospiraceae bacterium]|nr:MAG: UV DNA damage repair endonuclease UvsE [Nitrospiraceae bacterium]